MVRLFDEKMCYLNGTLVPAAECADASYKKTIAHSVLDAHNTSGEDGARNAFGAHRLFLRLFFSPRLFRPRALCGSGHAGAREARGTLREGA